MATVKKSKKNPPRATHHLEKLKNWLIERELMLSNKDISPSEISLTLPETDVDPDHNHNTGFDSRDVFNVDDIATFELLNGFINVLENHPEDKSRFFSVIEKMMDTKASKSLNLSDIRFMKELVDEVIFMIEEEE